MRRSMRDAEMERETWPYESCLECLLRMPSDEHAEAHHRMTGHAMGWPLDTDEMAWPATDEQVCS
jgi:hypothetical protein